MDDLKEFERQYLKMKQWNTERAEEEKKAMDRCYVLKEVFKEQKLKQQEVKNEQNY